MPKKKTQDRGQYVSFWAEKGLDKVVDELLKTHKNKSIIMRKALMMYAETLLQNAELLNAVKNEDLDAVTDIFSDKLTNHLELVRNIIDDRVEKINERFDKLEKIMDIFVYTMLYHMPEVPEERKMDAMASADKRKEAVYDLINDIDI